MYIFFGLPGSGKTFAGKVAEKYFGYFVYDGDNNLTDELHFAFKNQRTVTDAMRDDFFNKLQQSTKKLAQKHQKLIITQTFIKEKYRKQFLKTFPEAKFVLIQTPTAIREDRLAYRKEYPLDKEYARKMVLLFEKPEIDYYILENTNKGEVSLKEQLAKILV